MMLTITLSTNLLQSMPIHLNSKFMSRYQVCLVTKFNLVMRVFQALLDDSIHEAELLMQALSS